ncbi:MAG: ATP-binding protein [Nitrospirae bacterium]|nr:ATP-binding protein [Nitrospirota bacterium]
MPDLLRSAVVYGANASGKSNILRALHFMDFFVVKSFSKFSEGDTIAVKPFLFNAESAKNPTELEITFIIDETRYQYGFSATSAMITKEWLISYPQGRYNIWFARIFDQESSDYKWKFGRKFTGQKQVIKTATRKNALFLSTASQLNDVQMKPIYNWFLNQLDIVSLPSLRLYLNKTIDRYEADHRRIMSLIKKSDATISGIEIDKLPVHPSMLTNMLRDEDLLVNEDEINEIAKTMKIVSGIRTVHDSSKGQITLDFDDDDSNGTQKMFALSGLWLEVLDKGGVLCLDELDASLHPLLVHHLIEMFHDPKINPKNAQLIFNTHDTTLLNPYIYRRDQVWFTEKDSFSATKLYSLAEFKPEKKEDLERGYLAGRYGAIPYFGDFEF